MSQDLYDKVLFYKGRVWTIYALTGDGVFAFQGLKPYSSFKYDSNRHEKNISYIKMVEVLECIIEGEKIAECVDIERKSDAKKLSKKMAVEFLSYLTGHTSGKINCEIIEQEGRVNGSFTVVLGQVRYDIWKMDGRLHLHHNMHGTTTGTTFDFVTWKVDSNYEDRERRQSQRDERELIIEDYKHQYQCRCDEKK